MLWFLSVLSYLNVKRCSEDLIKLFILKKSQKYIFILTWNSLVKHRNEQNYVRHKAGKCEKDHFCIGHSFSFAIASQLDKLVAVFFPLGIKKEAETRYKEFSLWKQFHLEILSLSLLSQDFSFHIHSEIFVPKLKKKEKMFFDLSDRIHELTTSCYLKIHFIWDIYKHCA